MNDWIRNLKVGDEVSISTRYGSGISCLTTVGRITKTLIITASGDRFKINGGYEPGDDYGRRHLIAVTDKVKEGIERRRLIDKIKSNSLEHVSIDDLRKIWEMVK
jgi:hypothetical protein